MVKKLNMVDALDNVQPQLSFCKKFKDFKTVTENESMQAQNSV